MTRLLQIHRWERPNRLMEVVEAYQIQIEAVMDTCVSASRASPLHCPWMLRPTEERPNVGVGHQQRVRAVLLRLVEPTMRPSTGKFAVQYRLAHQT